MNIPVPDTKPLCWAALSGIALCIAALVLASCTSCQPGTAEGHIRSSLDAFALVADPAWSAANEACAQRQRAIAAEAEADRLTVQAAREELAPVRARCHAITALFQRMREAHEQAVGMVEAGRVQEAEAWLTRLRERWRDLGDLEAEAVADAGAEAALPALLVADAGGAP
jgi:hypothetical protein